MKDKRRVVVTGYSAVTPIGSGNEKFWENNINGLSGINKIDQFEVPKSMSDIAGIVKDLNANKLKMDENEYEKLDRSLIFAIYASKEALKLANIREDILNNNEIKANVHIATAISNIEKMEKTLRKITKDGMADFQYDRHNSQYIKNWFKFNSISEYLGECFGFNGEHSVIATGCTGGVDAIGHAFHKIRNGDAEIALTGSTEAPISPLTVSAFSKINATSKSKIAPHKVSRPFDIDRSGFVLAEGCGILVLESLENAQKRNAKIYAEIKGFGSCNNAIHMTDIPEDGSSIAESIELALLDGNINKDSIDYVNLHGSSTKQNDIAESNAMHKIFNNASTIPVTSIKSQIGHSLAASNSIEIVSVINSINSGVIPPTINLESQDEKCNLNVVKSLNYKKRINNVLKISSGFSGIHSSLIMGEFEGEYYE